MSNNKPANERKRNHLNVNFTDADLEKVNIILNANPDMKLDKLIVYSLLKIYGENFESDYNAQFLQALYERKAKLSKEIEELEKMIEQKKSDLNEVEERITEVSNGTENSEILQSHGKTDGYAETDVRTAGTVGKCDCGKSD